MKTKVEKLKELKILQSRKLEMKKNLLKEIKEISKEIKDLEEYFLLVNSARQD